MRSKPCVRPQKGPCAKKVKKKKKGGGVEGGLSELRVQ